MCPDRASKSFSPWSHNLKEAHSRPRTPRLPGGDLSGEAHCPAQRTNPRCARPCRDRDGAHAGCAASAVSFSSWPVEAGD
jgi:hypothetical protein